MKFSSLIRVDGIGRSRYLIHGCILKIREIILFTYLFLEKQHV